MSFFGPVQSVLLGLALTMRIALQALLRNKLRSSLTGLGIIIGVGAVVTMVAVGNGAQANIESKVSALGQNLLMVFAGSKNSVGVNTGMGSSSALVLGDVEAIRREIPDVIALSPEVRTSAQLIANGRNWPTQVLGESEDYVSIRNWVIAAGSNFSQRDVQSAAKVALIGSKTATQLFGPENPVGRMVRVKSIPFVIVGTLDSKGAGMGGNNQDDTLIIPYTTAMKQLTGQRHLKALNLQIVRSERMTAAQALVTSLLRQRHKLGAGVNNDFSILNQQEIADTLGSITTVITLLLGSVAGISLLVGGIGIMNIMLVSVTERTREIGIRIAVGAQGYDILLQFLIEAITLSVLGGGIGILLGIGGAKLASMGMGFDAIVSINSVILAFSVSAAIGIFFGFYPARRAAAMDPIEALRYE